MRTGVFKARTLVGLLAFTIASAFAGLAAQGQPMAVPPEPALQAALRDLWVGHVFWVRNVVILTKLKNQAGAKVAEDQVVQDARDIANAIAPFYGQPAADKLFGLLAGHYGAVKQYMTAAFAKKASAQTAAKNALDSNAEEIATFLSSANPNWPKAAVLEALQMHGAHHVAEIDAVNALDFKTEAANWNDMRTHIYAIADLLAQGLEKQFGTAGN